MITQELFQAMVRERMVEGARLRAERQARALTQEKPSVDRSQARRHGWLPLPSFIVEVLRGVPAS